MLCRGFRDNPGVEVCLKQLRQIGTVPAGITAVWHNHFRLPHIYCFTKPYLVGNFHSLSYCNFSFTFNQQIFVRNYVFACQLHARAMPPLRHHVVIGQTITKWLYFFVLSNILSCVARPPRLRAKMSKSHLIYEFIYG